MYPRGELDQLLGHKAVLRRRIAARRAECADAAAEAVRPLVWLDHAADMWKRLAPLAQITALPVLLVAKRLFFPRAKLLGVLLRWGPLAFSIFRSRHQPRR